MIASDSVENINDFLIDLGLKGIASVNPHIVKQAKIITPEILLKMHGKLNMNKAKDVVYWCLFLFAFFLFARKSNLVPTKINEIDSNKILLRQDVQLINGVLVVSIKWSKTIQFGEKVLQIPLIEIPGSYLCPVVAYKNMCSLVSANETDPLFSLPCRKCIVYSQFQSKLRELLRQIGLNSVLYSTHSFRRGGTTLAFKAEVPVELIKAHGDWKTDCYQKYLSFLWQAKCTLIRKTWFIREKPGFAI